MSLEKIKRIGKEEFKESKWSGGETTELVIFPQGYDFKERDFIFRISSATFSSTSSTFSDFKGYNRYILPLEGEIYLNHKDKYERSIKPYEVEFFNGAWQTDSKNSLDCRDFNFIVKENVHSNLTVVKENENFTYIPKRNGKLILFSMGDFKIELYYEYKKEIEGRKDEILIISEEEKLNKVLFKDLKSKVIICEVLI